MTNLPNPGTLSLPPSPWEAEVWLVPAESDKTPTQMVGGRLFRTSNLVLELSGF